MSSIGHHYPKAVVTKAGHDKISRHNVSGSQAGKFKTSPMSEASDSQSAAHRASITSNEHAESQQRFKWLHNAALVQLGDLSQSYPVDHNVIQFKQQIGELAADNKAFHRVMQTAYGEAVSAKQVEALRAQVLEKDFSWLPQVQYVAADILHGADGAYSGDLNTIYINEDARGTALSYLVYAEEVGHSIDRLLNERDSAGDEGAVFALLLTNAPISSADLSLLLTNKDSGSIEINGQIINVEFSSWLSKAIDLLVEQGKSFIDNVEDQLNRFTDAVSGLMEDVADILITVVSRPLEIIEIIGDGLAGALELMMDGKYGQAGTLIRDLLVNSGKLALSTIPEVVAMVFSSMVVAADRLRGAIDERPLRVEEAAYLWNVFGSSIDYEAINIVSGGTKDQWNMDAHVVGNEIFLPDTLDDGSPMFADDGSLTPGGLKLLCHEVAHVWQFQNFGTEYIGESLVRQFYDGDNDTYDWYHDVEAGIEFVDMNPEKQAEVASIIGETFHSQVVQGLVPELTLAALNNVLINDNIVLTAAQFRIFENAWQVLNPLASDRNFTHNPILVGTPTEERAVF